MSDRLGLIRAIQEQPGDDLPRLAYADWLEEQGEDEHAEFIRVEVRLSHLSKQDAEWRPLFERELELIRAGKDEWFGKERQHWTYEMRRGFIEEISTNEPDSVLPLIDWLYDHHTLQDLCVAGSWKELQFVLSHPLARFLARLLLLGRRGYDPTLLYQSSASGPPLARGLPLEVRPLALSLSGHRMGVELVEGLLESDVLDRLTWLDLTENSLGVQGLRKLFASRDRFPRLTALRVSGVARSAQSGTQFVNQNVPPSTVNTTENIGPEGIRWLASEPALARLTRLDIEDNRIDSAGIQALIDSPFLSRIEHLGVGARVGSEGVRLLKERFGSAVAVSD